MLESDCEVSRPQAATGVTTAGDIRWSAGPTPVPELA